MKYWKEANQQTKTRRNNSISGYYKKEILDTRITVSEITKNMRTSERQALRDKIEKIPTGIFF